MHFSRSWSEVRVTALSVTMEIRTAGTQALLSEANLEEIDHWGLMVLEQIIKL